MTNDSGMETEEEYIEDQLERALDQAEYNREAEREESAIKQLEDGNDWKSKHYNANAIFGKSDQ